MNWYEEGRKRGQEIIDNQINEDLMTGLDQIKYFESLGGKATISSPNSYSFEYTDYFNEFNKGKNDRLNEEEEKVLGPTRDEFFKELKVLLNKFPDIDLSNLNDYDDTAIIIKIKSGILNRIYEYT